MWFISLIVQKMTRRAICCVHVVVVLSEHFLNHFLDHASKEENPRNIDWLFPLFLQASAIYLLGLRTENLFQVNINGFNKFSQINSHIKLNSEVLNSFNATGKVFQLLPSLDYDKNNYKRPAITMDH